MLENVRGVLTGSEVVLNLPEVVLTRSEVVLTKIKGCSDKIRRGGEQVRAGKEKGRYITDGVLDSGEGASNEPEKRKIQFLKKNCIFLFLYIRVKLKRMFL